MSSSDACSERAATAGGFASARVSRFTELAHTLQKIPLRSLALLGLAVLVLVLEVTSVRQAGHGRLESARDGLAEHDAVSLGSGLPLVARVLPKLLRGDGQHG
jgi:hypothetical protein